METDAQGSFPASHEITAFRRFTRLYTRFIGTLQEGLLGTSYSLSEARVLYELATRRRPLAKEITQELGMDAGYLSRILSKFQEGGLLKRSASLDDGRQVHLTLTKEGRAAFRNLNARSDRQASSILGALAPASRHELIRSMRAIEEILEAEAKPEGKANPASFSLRTHRPGDMGWVVHREGALYAQEYGWDERFEALAARVVADFIEHFDPTCERCWIAERDDQSLQRDDQSLQRDDQPLGHIFLVKHPERHGVAKLRLLLVEPSARGMGVGHALVAECVRFAREAGYQKITLWTQSILTAAHRIYQQAGFRLVHEEPHHSFGKDLVAQTWELDLR
jgi:DNA-binding MarR family transcriptional regulator/GNAT superfamily N-acetyltransferase